jgi:hypothetical protein
MDDREFELWLLSHKTIVNNTNQILDNVIDNNQISDDIIDEPDYDFPDDDSDDYLWWWLNKERLDYIIYRQPYWDVKKLFSDERVEFENYSFKINPRFIKSTKYVTDIKYVKILFPNQFKRAFVKEFICIDKQKQRDNNDYTEYVWYLIEDNEFRLNYNYIINMFKDVPYVEEITKGRIPTHVLEWMLSGNKNYILNTMTTRSILGPNSHVVNVRIFGDEYWEINNFERYVYDTVKKYIPHNVVIFNYRPGWLSFRSEKKNNYYAREIDIWFPEWEFGIECNGEHWHRSTRIKERDNLKLQKCNDVGYDLIVVNSEPVKCIEDVIINGLKNIKNNDIRRGEWFV